MRVPPIPKWISIPVVLGWLIAFIYFANGEGRDNRTISLVLGGIAVLFFVALYAIAYVEDHWGPRRKH